MSAILALFCCGIVLLTYGAGPTTTKSFDSTTISTTSSTQSSTYHGSHFVEILPADGTVSIPANDQSHRQFTLSVDGSIYGCVKTTVQVNMVLYLYGVPGFYDLEVVTPQHPFCYSNFPMHAGQYLLVFADHQSSPALVTATQTLVVFYPDQPIIPP